MVVEEFGDSYLSGSLGTEALEVEQEPQVTTEEGLSLRVPLGNGICWRRKDLSSCYSRHAVTCAIRL